MSQDITGQKFNRLVAIRELPEKNNQGLIMWEFECECGNIIKAPKSYVTRGRKKSCGCLKSDMLIERNIANGRPLVIGEIFGNLTVLEDLGFKQSFRGKRQRWALCQCSCGNIIEVCTNNLYTGNTQSCGCTTSRGEYLIGKLLREHNINFSTQYTFKDLTTNGYQLRFDFAIFKDNLLYELIEFDGRQHFEGPDAKWTESSSLEEIQFRDRLKDAYCKEHNIKLIRIPYTDINKLNLYLADLIE